MATIFVTRHPGAIAWAARRGITAAAVEHLDVTRIGSGDLVLGTLPVHLAAAVCALGARFLFLELDLPAEARGRALSAEDMDRFGARLVEYRVERVNDQQDGDVR